MWFPLQLLAIFFWANINVLDSLLVRRYRRSPVALMWNQSYYSMIVLAVTALMINVHAVWMLPLFLVGVLGYAGDLIFFVALKHIDASVTNIAWVILSVLLSFGGFLWFGETWTTMETMGALLVFLGVIVLSLWQWRADGGMSLFLLPLLALLYTPFYLSQKAALLSGDSIISVSFWSLLGREIMSFMFPLLMPALRRDVVGAMRAADAPFFLINLTVIMLFFAATGLTTAAFLIGPVSLVAIVGNVQPFFVLFLAGVTIRFLPSLAPRELVDSGSVAAKIGCFSIAFLGLALLALAQ